MIIAVPMKKDKLDGYLDAVEHLPPTPALMIRLIDLFRQPDRDVDEVVGLMRQDPAVTAEVLRRCNSSFFGNDEPVMDIYDAVFRLGFYEVYRVTVALFGQQSMATAKVAQGIDVELLWRHSAMTAIAGGAMARHLGESEGIAFTAGLLHDVGKIVMASAEGARYADLLRQHGYKGLAPLFEEKVLFGFSHDGIGARLLQRWGVPEEVWMPVLGHHQTEWEGPCARMAAIVNLANLMAHCLENAGADEPCELPDAEHAMAVLELAPDDMPTLVHRSRNDIQLLSSLLMSVAA